MLEGQLPAAAPCASRSRCSPVWPTPTRRASCTATSSRRTSCSAREAGLEEHLRILDFGLAKLRDGPAMTAGMAVGTPSYMSPEQSGADGEIDARTDIYTVGVLLFELLAGRKPFQSDNVGE